MDLRILAEGAKEALEDTVSDKIPKGTYDVRTILNWVYALMGMVAVIGIIFGAVTWVTSLGDPAKTKKGRDAVLYSVIGLAIVLLAMTITTFVISVVGGAGE